MDNANELIAKVLSPQDVVWWAQIVDPKSVPYLDPGNTYNAFVGNFNRLLVSAATQVKSPTAKNRLAVVTVPSHFSGAVTARLREAGWQIVIWNIPGGPNLLYWELLPIGYSPISGEPYDAGKIVPRY